MDATFVDAPRQRNTREENASKLRQKDTDARWTKKGNETHYGYKDHVKADAESKLISDCIVTRANVHDSRALLELVDGKDRVLYADSAHSGAELQVKLPEKVEARIHEKGYRNRPLTEAQEKSSRKKSKTGFG